MIWLKIKTDNMNKPFKIKNPYPTNRKGKINPNSEGSTDLKDGRSKSSSFQKAAPTKNYNKGYKTPGA